METAGSFIIIFPLSLYSKQDSSTGVSWSWGGLKDGNRNLGDVSKSGPA